MINLYCLWGICRSPNKESNELNETGGAGSSPTFFLGDT